MNDFTETIPCAECGKPVSKVVARERSGLCLSCVIKHVEKVLCAECGKPTSARLARMRNGLCGRCSARRNPFFVLGMSLVDRVWSSPDGSGFATLSGDEKLYYAMTLLQDEVNNGGFHQFFFNSSGSYYELIESGLVTFDEPKIQELLQQAKRIVFADVAVPAELRTRRERMRDCATSQLDELDRRFYSLPDTLTPKLKAFAHEKGLLPKEATSDQAS